MAYESKIAVIYCNGLKFMETLYSLPTNAMLFSSPRTSGQGITSPSTLTPPPPPPRLYCRNTMRQYETDSTL
ncbi:Hypothetical predicted protein [Octopus vulgaris]|uniref:Uncharacterized protein n=1 Tax=Octopus vulgaris TaxID=6645 RepID=A0AA36BH57_OCTVU|nr:Hypothetical predicted protein [Octopus vulgaris]